MIKLVFLGFLICYFSAAQASNLKKSISNEVKLALENTAIPKLLKKEVLAQITSSSESFDSEEKDEKSKESTIEEFGSEKVYIIKTNKEIIAHHQTYNMLFTLTSEESAEYSVSGYKYYDSGVIHFMFGDSNTPNAIEWFPIDKAWFLSYKEDPVLLLNLLGIIHVSLIKYMWKMPNYYTDDKIIASSSISAYLERKLAFLKCKKEKKAEFTCDMTAPKPAEMNLIPIEKSGLNTKNVFEFGKDFPILQTETICKFHADHESKLQIFNTINMVSKKMSFKKQYADKKTNELQKFCWSFLERIKNL